MAQHWTKKQEDEKKKTAETADFKDFFADNVYKNKEQIPQEVKIEGMA